MLLHVAQQHGGTLNVQTQTGARYHLINISATSTSYTKYYLSIGTSTSPQIYALPRTTARLIEMDSIKAHVSVEALESWLGGLWDRRLRILLRYGIHQELLKRLEDISRCRKVTLG
jgi:hypothetical protein